MTEKRFTIEIWQEGSLFYKDDKEDFSTHNSTSYVTNLVENKLNKLSDENEQLKREKERYKRLSEIRDENINNRILSLKEFINNCEDENVKNTLKDLFYSEVKEYDLAKENRKLKRENEQLKSDNKEYIKGLDLAKATSQSWASDVRELREENCRLKKKNERLIKKIKRERASTTKQHLKWSDEAEEIINDLRRENEELKKENKHLRCTIESNSQDDYIDYLEKQNERLKDSIDGLTGTMAHIEDLGDVDD